MNAGTLRNGRHDATRTRSRLGRLLLLLALAWMPAAAQAQNICVPPSLGVPPQYKPPHWWGVPANPSTTDCTNIGEPVYCAQRDDPRWEGAAAVAKNDGSVSYRFAFYALQDGTNLYLSWRYRGMALSANSAQNTLYYGYLRASDGQPVIAQAGLLAYGQSTTTDGTTSNTANLIDQTNTACSVTNCPLGGSLAVPTWVANTSRVWINTPDVNSYAVQVQIPLSEIQVSGGQFQLWFEMLAGDPSVDVTRFAWPQGQDIVSSSTFPYPNIFPLPAKWATYQLSSGPTDATCPAQGVSLDQDQVSTDNTPYANTIYYKLSPDTKPVNVIWARPTNHTGATIPAGKLQADFRIANWGSNPNFEDWEQGVTVDQLWAHVPCQENTNGPVPTIGDINDGTTANATNELRCTWTLTDAEANQFIAGTRKDHECILVEMSDTMSPGLVYRNRSIWNNFDVRKASSIKEPGQITIKGLKAVAPDGRDVYVYVEALIMPASAEPPKCEPATTTGAAGAGKNERASMVGVVGEGPGPLLCAISQGRVQPHDLAVAVANHQVTEAQLDAVIPTYRVHVFHDTGLTVTIGGTKRPVLNPQGSFGFRVLHAGDLTGWRHDLHFDSGYQVDEIAPDYYRIRKVPNGGTVGVTTVVEAVEPRKYSVGLRAGAAIPQGGLSNSYSTNFALTFDFEYAFNRTLSVLVAGGRDAFSGKSGAKDLTVWRLQALGRAYALYGPIRVFAQVGVGYYLFDPGSNKGGASLGAGALYELTPDWAIEATYDAHGVTSGGTKSSWSDVQAGVRYRF
ncbi:MAG TPA: hypothetical protein VLU43_03470 [Anaeromyxobacteraceae bacterium]|nr:hypothetical protein [Anaeromyxobacteraceae bacterium]